MTNEERGKRSFSNKILTVKVFNMPIQFFYICVHDVCMCACMFVCLWVFLRVNVCVCVFVSRSEPIDVCVPLNYCFSKIYKNAQKRRNKVQL